MGDTNHNIPKIVKRFSIVESEKTTKNINNDVDYDDLILSAGELGRYQWKLFILTFPYYWFGVFVYFGQVFLTETPSNHWCWIPELENFTEAERRSIAIPPDENTRSGYSQCETYVANWTEVIFSGILPNTSWTKQKCKNGWEFDLTEIPYPTISSELKWVCDKNSYQATAQSLFFVGSITGGFLIGWVADKYGRLPATVASNLIGCIGGVLTIFSMSFIDFSIYRFLVGMAYDNCMIMPYLIILEYVAPKHRTMLANLSFALFYASAAILLPWIALACGHWKIIALATSLPLAFAIFTPFIIPESPRWLLSKGRIDDAIDKVLEIAKVNNKEIHPKQIVQFKTTLVKNNEEQSYSILEILKRPILRKVFTLICLEFVCCTIVFDALVRSIGALDFDFFVSFSVVSFTEFPSMLLIAFVMDWMGRRWLTTVVMAISCIFSILSVFVGGGLPSVMCAVVARFAVNMSYSAAMQWGVEMLPTSVRGSGMSIIHICGYIGTVLSPFIVYLETYIYWLPLVVVGVVAGLGSIIALFLPETAKRDMPHTFEDAEELIESQKFWDNPFKKKTNKDDLGNVNSSFEM